MANQPVSSTFVRILKSFQSRLSSEDIENFRFTTFEDLKEAIKTIQQDQADRQGLRNLNKIRPFITFLEQYSRVIEQFVTADPQILAFIWGPIKFCLQIASRIFQAFDALLDAYARIAEFLPVLTAADHVFCSHPHVKQILADIYEDILDFHKRATLFFKQRTWKLASKLTYHTFEHLFEDVLRKLGRSKELLFQMASITGFQEAQESRLLFTKEFEVQTERDLKHRMLTVMEWLAPELCDLQHEEIQEKRLGFPNTTQWIYRTTAMLDWLRRDSAMNPIFWLLGIPGAGKEPIAPLKESSLTRVSTLGKTFLFSSVVDVMGEEHPESQMVFFYCKNTEPSRRTFAAIARSVLAQLLKLNPSCLDYLYDKAVSSGSLTHTTATYRELVETIAMNHEYLIIGIDGLDECEESERRNIMLMIENILRVSHKEQNVKFFLTSRREKDIELSLSSAIRLNVEPRHIERDIRTYIRVRCSELVKKFALNSGEERNIISKISSRPEGMFLLARLIIDNLLSQDNLEDLEEELDSDILPTGIDEAYARMLVRLKKKHRSQKSQSRAQLVLELLTAARRSLHLHEVQGALSICLDDKTVNFERRHSRTPLDEICGPIVEIHANGVVNFVHPTVKGYLVQHHSGSFIDSTAAALKMATLCASYLTFDCFSLDLGDAEAREYVRSGHYGFQEYATCTWIDHAISVLEDHGTADAEGVAALEAVCNIIYLRHTEQRTGLSPAPAIGELTNKSFREKLDCLQRAYNHVESVGDSGAPRVSTEALPYLIRSVLQVRGIVEELSATEVIEDAPLARAYGTAIFKCPVVQCPYFDQGFSTRRVRDEHSKGHSREYKCTVSSCDYSSIGFSTNSALRRHSAICHESLPNIPTFPKAKRLSTARALKDAIDQGNDLAVRALATEISTVGSWETGFILQAVKRESWSVASILIEVLGTEAELNHRAADGKAALHFVAAKGNEGLLRKILEKCANLDLLDSRSRSALLYAILGLHFECAKLLLRSSFTRIISYRTDVAQAFLAAAADGQIEILQFLIRKANRMNGSEQFKALEVAAENGRGKVVRFLLEEGRRLGTQYPYSSVLRQKQPESLSIDEMEALLMVSTTAGKAQAEILQKVVEHEETERVAQILEQKYCRSADAWHVALKTAAGKGSIRIVELLLSVEAKLLTARRNPIVAVKPAAACGHPDIIELLLSPDANMDAPASLHISTFLLRTAINGQRYLAMILAETEASSDRGGQFANATILQLAADGFSSMLLHELAIKGDIFIQDKDALVNAAMTGHEGMVQVLTMAGPQLLDIDSFREAGRLIAAGNLSIYCALSEAIVAAIEYGNSEVIRILLDSGAGAKWVRPSDKWQPTYQPLTTLEDSQMQLRLLGQQNKNSALQDYHFLIILLEQQNKKRLLMARLERDARNMP